MCKLTNNDELFVENVYNNNPYPQFIDDTYVNIGISNQAFVKNQGVFTCSFRRSIRIGQYVDKFFDLNNLYYAFLAKGSLDADGRIYFLCYSYL